MPSRRTSKIAKKILACIARHPPEQAIEAACRLINDGCDVYGISSG
jgi:hypothetical protein